MPDNSAGYKAKRAGESESKDSTWRCLLFQIRWPREGLWDEVTFEQRLKVVRKEAMQGPGQRAFQEEEAKVQTPLGAKVWSVPGIQTLQGNTERMR